MSKKPSKQGKNPIIDDRGLAFAVYIMYFLGYVTGITTAMSTWLSGPV